MSELSSVPPSLEECRNLRALLADALLSGVTSRRTRQSPLNPVGVRVNFHGYLISVLPCGHQQMTYVVSSMDAVLEQGVLRWTRDDSEAPCFTSINSVGGFGDAT